jgi:hypothetical protein
LGGKPDCFCPVRFRQNRQGIHILSEAGLSSLASASRTSSQRLK